MGLSEFKGNNSKANPFRRRHRGNHGQSDSLKTIAANLYANWAPRVEGLIHICYIPIALFGVAFSSAIREILGTKSYPLVGGAIAAFGICLSAEAYWVGLGNGFPFLPKLGIPDGASIGTLSAIVQSDQLGSFLFLVGMAIAFQIIESVPWVIGLRRSRGLVSWVVWVLVGLGYAVDIHSVWATYSQNPLNLTTLAWALVSLLGAEFGLALAAVRK